MFNPGTSLMSQDELAEQQRSGDRYEEQKQEASAQQSRDFNTNVNQAMSMMVQALSQNKAKDQIPQYNQHEMQGRTGLVDPSMVQQQTMLPFTRRYDQAANLSAIINALPPQMHQQNEAIVRAVNTSVPQLQKQLKQGNSLYQMGSAGFVSNRVNIELQKRRLNSIYAVI